MPLIAQRVLPFLPPRYNAYYNLATDAPDVVDCGRSQDNTFWEDQLNRNLERIKPLDADGPHFIEGATTICLKEARKTQISGNVSIDEAKLEVVS